MTHPGSDDAPVRTVFLGSGAFAVPILEALARHPAIDLVGIVTAPARPSGRGQRSNPSPVADAAARQFDAVPVLAPSRLRDPGSVDAILALRPDLVVLADYGQIVPAALLSTTHGALNLHPSLLPRHRGATPIPAAILAGDRETGVTLMRMDEGLDTGPIIARTSVALAGTETTPDLESRLATSGAELLSVSLVPWLRGDLEPTAQPIDGATMTRPSRRSDGVLDVARSATELERRIRARQPWPGTFVETTAGRLVLWSAEPERAAEAERGRFDTRGLGVGDGERLVLGTVQPAGGRPMPWAAYVRGRPAIIGSTVRSPGD